MKSRKPSRAATVKRPRNGDAQPARPHRAPPPLITADELRRAIFELANTLAPADVDDLLGNEDDLRSRGARIEGEPGKLFAAQLELAITCLRDHAAGRCPQIPYFTISMLAAALAYLVDDLDLIPDFLPRIGTLDDALVMAMAFQLAEDGLRRYCTWKEFDPGPALRVPPRKG
jgi:uncharacterized membrane protein YkvA (DUF1232 family)